MSNDEINKFNLIKKIPFKEVKFNKNRKKKLKATLVIFFKKR